MYTQNRFGIGVCTWCVCARLVCVYRYIHTCVCVCVCVCSYLCSYMLICMYLYDDSGSAFDNWRVCARLDCVYMHIHVYNVHICILITHYPVPSALRSRRQLDDELGVYCNAAWKGSLVKPNLACWVSVDAAAYRGLRDHKDSKPLLSPKNGHSHKGVRKATWT